MKNSFFKILLSFSILALVSVLGITFWFYQLDQKIQKKLTEGTLQPPIEFYASADRWYIGHKLTQKAFQETLRQYDYRERVYPQRLQKRDYSLLSNEECSQLLQKPDFNSFNNCILFLNKTDADIQMIVFSEGEILEIYSGSPLKRRNFVQLDPILFAQYYGNRPILRELTSLSNIPTHCLNAVLAIEDPQFLSHQGISVKGILRAFYVNIIQRRRSQGGSTITQQLIKNLLLSHDKTIKRKVTEIAMALIFEFRVSKDQILENYLNLIYMGQNGSFAVSGFGSASKHYFDKSINKLNLNECSALAAILNSPGLFNPFRYPERFKTRQDRVLSKMVEHRFISKIEKNIAQKTPLKLAKGQQTNEPAPYFVDALRRKLKELDIDGEQGLKVYSTMNLQAQVHAQKEVEDGIEKIEEWYPQIKKKSLLGQKLQGVLISSNPLTGEVEALVGGRNYKKYPYNRALRAHRQIGSIIKPFVYLAALEALTTEGQPYTPMTLIKDEQKTFKYDNQEWTPENYDKTYNGEIPLFFGLKNSLNAATATLGVDVGLTSVIDILKRLQIQSDVKALPALTLGAYELYPLEVLQAYTTLANLGTHRKLHFIKSVENQNGEILYQFPQESHEETVISPQTAAVLVGMMKQTILSGTGQVVRKMNFLKPAAGKTGTTSDTRDAWFAGFTPYHVAVAWVGYDKNEEHGLTGASGAAPIWARYMKSYAERFPTEDFAWPQGTTRKEIDGAELVFRSENAPL